MSKQLFARHGMALVPADDKAVKAIKRLAAGECVTLMMERSRSPQWHRWFMGGCASIAENSDEPLTTHAVKEALKLFAGHVELVQSKSGEVFKVPRSIAFEKLTQDEWATIWPALDQAARDHFRFDFQLFREGYAGFYD